MAERLPPFRDLVDEIGRRAADVCLVTMAMVVMLLETLLMALGCLLLVGVLVANGQPERFALHAQNLAVHLLSADGAARRAFLGELGGMVTGIVVLLLLARGPAWLRRLRQELGRRKRHG